LLAIFSNTYCDIFFVPLLEGYSRFLTSILTSDGIFHKSAVCRLNWCHFTVTNSRSILNNGLCDGLALHVTSYRHFRFKRYGVRRKGCDFSTLLYNDI